MTRNIAFEAKVLTHLDYIKKKQEEHDQKLDSLASSFSCEKEKIDEKFDGVNKRIDTAEGFAKGAIAAGGIGIISSTINWFRVFK